MKKTFDGRSGDLTKTQVLPTLEAALTKGTNGVWCASFLAAWKKLAADLAGEDVTLDGTPGTAALLNKAADPRPQIPPGASYVAAGWRQQRVVQRIADDLKRFFPEKPIPTFRGMTDDSFVAYAYLEANVKFTLPYLQSRKPLEFSDSRGTKTGVTSFGIRWEDRSNYDQLRAQPGILFLKKGPLNKNQEFAIDLSTESSPSQVVVARIRAEATLAAAVARVEREQAELKARNKLGPNDVLLVPDLFGQISHRFSDLEGKAFKNRNLNGQQLDVAQQDILFRLDRSGAEIKSESTMYALSAGTNFVLDRPFLIYMKARGATAPYFAMWVDNPELLTPWSK